MTIQPSDVGTIKMQNIGGNLLLFLVAGLLLLFASHGIAAEYVLTAPPRESKANGEKIYGPIAEKLSEILGEKVVYEYAGTWAAYTKNMRDGRYDVVFDGPHFVGWRHRHLDHIPVAKLPGNLEFYIVARSDDQRINNPRQLIGKKICAMPSPNLATDMVYSLFSNPVLQPTIYEVKGGLPRAYTAFKRGACDATIFRSNQFEKLNVVERKQLKIVVRTQPMPNQTFSISQRLSKNRQKITEFFRSDVGIKAADALLERFSKNKKYFTDTPSDDKYEIAANVLEGVVFGW